MARDPLLPIEEEGRLQDPVLRQRFVERIFAHARLHAFFASRWTLDALVTFHDAHVLQLLAHSEKIGRRLNRLVAESRQLSRTALRNAYRTLFMQALACETTKRRQVNALREAAGRLAGAIDMDQGRELAERIECYRRGELPLGDPIARIRHHVQRLKVSDVALQLYLESVPKEFRLGELPRRLLA